MVILDAYEELNYIAKCLYAVGNDKLAETIAKISQDVYTASMGIRREAAEKLNQRIADSEQSTKNMVEACLAGIVIGGEEGALDTDENSNKTDEEKS